MGKVGSASPGPYDTDSSYLHRDSTLLYITVGGWIWMVDGCVRAACWLARRRGWDYFDQCYAINGIRKENSYYYTIVAESKVV